MAITNNRYLGKSKKYKNVCSYQHSTNEILFFGNVCGQRKHGFKDERKCALWVDTQLIRKGKEPVNILVKKL
jgi:hypothetical protein